MEANDADDTWVRNFKDMVLVTKFLGTILGLGMMCLTLYSATVVGWSLMGPFLWSLALTAAGMMIGFLFGIPTVVQGDSQGPPASGEPLAEEDDSSQPSRYRQKVNTNLEDISDWLTKILVGAGLVQLSKIAEFLNGLGYTIGRSLGNDEVAHAIAIAMIVLFTVMGFLYGFLLTRLYLQGALARADLDVPGELRRTVNALVTTVAPTVGRRRPRRAADLEGNIVSDETWNEDPHKGFAKGKSEQNHRRLTAEIQPVSGTGAVNRVHLEVASTSLAHPLRGPVTFLLHPTFAENKIEVHPNAKGVASLDILAAGVFTVGATADSGATKLELNLADVTGGSEAFYKN